MIFKDLLSCSAGLFFCGSLGNKYFRGTNQREMTI